jgi:hypothetical protein
MTWQNSSNHMEKVFSVAGILTWQSNSNHTEKFSTLLGYSAI